MKKNRFLIDAWSIEESGKNWGEADGELCEALDFFNSYIMHMRELDKGLELVDTEEECKCIYIPIGVGVAVPPWNFPLSLLAGMVVSAVITGNTIVCKPSSDTPIVAYKFVELCEKQVSGRRYQFHSWIRFRHRGLYCTASADTLRNFTGSKEVGLRISQKAAEVSEGPDLDQTCRSRNGWKECDYRRFFRRPETCRCRNRKFSVLFPGTEMLRMLQSSRIKRCI